VSNSVIVGGKMAYLDGILISSEFRDLTATMALYVNRDDSEVAPLLDLGQAPHTGIWIPKATTQHLPTSLARLFSVRKTLSHLNVQSCLISAILAVLLIALRQKNLASLSVQLRWKQLA